MCDVILEGVGKARLAMFVGFIVVMRCLCLFIFEMFVRYHIYTVVLYRPADSVYPMTDTPGCLHVIYRQLPFFLSLGLFFLFLFFQALIARKQDSIWEFSKRYLYLFTLQ